MQITISSGKTLDGSGEENLLRTLKKGGIYLASSCGGKGTCGKCRLKIVEGRYRTAPSGKLSSKDTASGIVLACQTFPESDIVLDIPKESHIVVGDVLEMSRVSDLLASFRSSGGSLSPLVEWVRLRMDPPTIDDNISDLERLRKNLDAVGCENMRFPHGVIASLADSLREASWHIQLGYTEGPEAVMVKPVSRCGKAGLAIDIGTTTIVLYLVNLDDGSLVDACSTYNSQIRIGDDVITRIVYATESGGVAELQEIVVNDLNTLLLSLAEKHGVRLDEIESAVVAGNTTMTHLFWGLPPGYIREEPYTPTVNFFPLWPAKTVGLKIADLAPIYTMPCVASYVGGDIVAGVLASGMHRRSGISLFMDIGTNGEIVVGNREWLVTAACSAGPCFEGSGIRHGMRATEGAIEAVAIDHSTLAPAVRVIGNGPPIGICGSGMIDAVTELFLAGALDRKGNFIIERAPGRIREGDEGLEFVIGSNGGRDIVLTEVDIENILRAKAALFAGVSLLLKKVGLALDSIERVYIAGGFGNYLNVEKAIVMGMLPDLPRDKFRFLGNTAIAGAYLCLLSAEKRAEAEEIARKMTNVELSVSKRFMDEYLSALFLPHTDTSLFPSVENLLEKI